MFKAMNLLIRKVFRKMLLDHVTLITTVVVTTILGVIGSLVVGARFWARKNVQRRMHASDWLMLLSLVCDFLAMPNRHDSDDKIQGPAIFLLAVNCYGMENIAVRHIQHRTHLT